MGKITMQDIADALNISRVTVSKAFNDQSGVSESLRTLIFEKAAELGYGKVPFHMTEQTPPDTKTISLVVSRPDSAVFWTGIIHRMAQELASHNINLMYTYVPSVYTKDFVLPAILQNGGADGMVMLNIYDPTILDIVNRLPLPKVFLDTVPSITNRQLNGDLLLIEGYYTVLEITESLIRTGHQKIGFIGDISYALTNMERYRGYVACMEKHNLFINPDFCQTKPIGIFSYAGELNAYLDRLVTWPDAFVCVSDYVAHFVQQYIDEHPGRIPHPVTLTGFDNSSEYTNVAGCITTANVSTSLLGKRLAIQLDFRTDHPDAPYELTFINPSIVIHNK